MGKKIAIRGEITELDQAAMTFKLQPIYGPNKVSGPIPEQYCDAFLKALNGNKDHARVLIEGVTEDVRKRNPQNNLLTLESVERVSMLHPLDVPARLDELRNMQAGWHEGILILQCLLI